MTDFAEAIKAIEDQMAAARTATGDYPARIWVTPFAPKGSLLDAPWPEDDDVVAPLLTNRRQILCHPDDWAAIEKFAVAEAKGGNPPVTALWGIPVIMDDWT